MIGELRATRVVHQEIYPSERIRRGLGESAAGSVFGNIGLNRDRSVADLRSKCLRFIAAGRIVDGTPHPARSKSPDDRGTDARPAPRHDRDRSVHLPSPPNSFRRSRMAFASLFA